MTKKLSAALFFAAAILFFACSKNTSDNDNSSFVGRWTLVETLADPGDGSVTRQPADTSKDYFIKFNSDNSIESNLYFHLDRFKKYNIINDSSVIFIDSNGSKFNYYYKISDPYLTITGGCIEACGSKFIQTSQPNSQQN